MPGNSHPKSLPIRRLLLSPSTGYGLRPSLTNLVTCALLWSACWTGSDPRLPAQDSPAAVDVVQALESRLVAAIAAAEKSVVAIARVRKEDRRLLLDQGLPGAPPAPTDSQFVPREYGTGVVIDANGLILTAYHVLGNPQENDYYVWINRAGYKAVPVETPMAADPWMDLAVLKIDAQNLEPIRLGNAEQLKKGQLVIALGNPLAIARDGQASASWGIIANLGRKAVPDAAAANDPSGGRDTLHHYGTLIQTDAKLNFGTSGGALINLKGEMVGLLISLSAGPQYDSAAGFAIPVDAHFKRTLQTLKEGKRADYGFLGIMPQGPTAEERARGLFGARVRDVVPGTPADQASLRPGDVILAVNNEGVFDELDLVRYVSSYPPETEVELTVLRNQQVFQRKVTLAKKALTSRRPAYAIQQDPVWRGLTVDYVTALPTFYRQTRWIDRSGCVGIRDVVRDSPAWKAGLRPGECIATVDGKPVASPRQFWAAVEGRTGTVTLGVLSTGRITQRAVPPEP